MTNTGLADLRRQLASTPAVVRTLLTGLPADLLTVNEGDGTWSPLQVLAHLAWGERDDWIPRVRKTLEKGVAEPFTPFDREAGFALYAGWPLDRLLDEFARLRTASLDALDAFALEPADLSKQGRHPEFGPVTLEQLLATWVTHDFAHLAQMARILARHHGQSVGPWRKYFSLLRDQPS
ncbi:MAG: DinB family protein [Acidobacteriota bacterium]